MPLHNSELKTGSGVRWDSVFFGPGFRKYRIIGGNICSNIQELKAINSPASSSLEPVLGN